MVGLVHYMIQSLTKDEKKTQNKRKNGIADLTAVPEKLSKIIITYINQWSPKLRSQNLTSRSISVWFPDFSRGAVSQKTHT